MHWPDLKFGLTYHVKCAPKDFEGVASAYQEKAANQPLWTLDAPADELGLENQKDNVKVRLSQNNGQMTVITNYKATEVERNTDALQRVFNALSQTDLFNRLLDVFPWGNQDEEVVIEIPQQAASDSQLSDANAPLDETIEKVNNVTLVTQPQGLPGMSVTVSLPKPLSKDVLASLPSIREIHQFDSQGMNMLDKAIHKADLNQLKTLLSHPEIDPNLAYRGLVTPIEYAASLGDIAIVREFLNHPKTQLGKAYQYAKKHDHQNVADLLKLYGGDPEKIRFHAGEKLAKKLLEAIDANDALSAIAILNHPKFNPDATYRTGSATAFYIACLEGKTDLVERMLARFNPDINTQKQKNKHTPLAVAADQGYTEVVRLLLKQPAVNPFLPNNEGKSPLELAQDNGHEDVVQMIQQYLDEHYDFANGWYKEK